MKTKLRPAFYEQADAVDYLEGLYVPQALVGVMAQNGKQKAGNVV